MEKQDYRTNYEHLMLLFPDRAVISVKEVASVLSCDPRTVRSTIQRSKNPLPATKIGKGAYVISIPSFARWLATEGR
ncbi:MAG: helix-turn-helix domain-containing protein [Clostridia bacterium]|nr:helix-turn-helix domain-containing protein [Clostridia bacterium]